MEIILWFFVFICFLGVGIDLNDIQDNQEKILRDIWIIKKRLGR